METQRSDVPGRVGLAPREEVHFLPPPPSGHEALTSPAQPISKGPRDSAAEASVRGWGMLHSAAPPGELQCT